MIFALMTRDFTASERKRVWSYQRFPLLIAALVGLSLAALMPQMSGPDEKGHVAYVAAFANGHLPVLPATEIADIDKGITWQAQHPPFFYLVAAPFYKVVTVVAPQSGLLVLRLLCVFFFVCTVFVTRKIAENFVSEKAAWLASLLVAFHPVIAYVSATANNESLAILLSTLCVWTALCANPPRQNGNNVGWGESRKSVIAVGVCTLCCGLALLTKLTSIAGITSAVYLVGLSREDKGWRHFRWMRAVIVLCGAVLVWLPWGLWMKSLYGAFLPSISYTPGLTGGPLAILLFPSDAAIMAVRSYSEFSAGFLSPFWLLRGYVPEPVMQSCSVVILLWIVWTAKKYPLMRFAPVAFIALYCIVLNTLLFRFYATSLFAARYTGAATVLFCVVVAYQMSSWKPLARAVALGGCSIVAASNFAFIFWFFLLRH